MLIQQTLHTVRPRKKKEPRHWQESILNLKMLEEAQQNMSCTNKCLKYLILLYHTELTTPRENGGYLKHLQPVCGSINFTNLNHRSAGWNEYIHKAIQRNKQCSKTFKIQKPKRLLSIQSSQRKYFNA